MIDYLLLFVVLYILFIRLFRHGGLQSSILAALAASAVMEASAINILVFLDKHIYFGYFPLDPYNVPTHTLLKLFAVPLFFISAKIFLRSESTKNSNILLIIGAALLSILNTLAKPSFTLILVPAVGLIVAYKFLKREYIDWPLLVFGILAPSILVLGWQYSVTFASQWSGLIRNKAMATRIGLMPFGQFIVWDVPLYLLLPKLILSTLFPIVVYISYWKRAVKDIHFNFVWLILLFGLLITYSFVEIRLTSGAVSPAGNFTWSGLIAVFILFVVALWFLLRQNLQGLPVERKDWFRLAACGSALTLHLVFGVVWYLEQFQLFSHNLY
jgi:hypothetical protein